MRRYTFVLLVLLMLTVLTPLSVLGAQETLQCEAGFRLFDNEYLATDPVCIPENPERFIALDMASLELLLYLGKNVVGSTTWVLDQYQTTLPEMADRVAGIEDLGFPVNLEKALALQPDIILSYNALEDFLSYENGSQIAPTVITSLVIDDWERSTAFWADVLNAQPTFEEMKANYDTRIAELKAALPFDPAEKEVSLVTANQYGASIWMLDTPQSKILTDIGFSRPESQRYDGPAAIERYGTRQTTPISAETLDLADGDIIYLYSYSTLDPEVIATENQAMVDFRANPIWQQLKGVKAGQDYVVGSQWFRAGTFLMSSAVIDDLFATLTDTQSSLPNPLDTFPTITAALTETPAAAATTCEEGFRLFDNELLFTDPVCIPVDPQRIVAVDSYALENLLALGVKPVASAVVGPFSVDYPQLTGLIDGVVDLGGYPPNLETMLSVQPDLILAIEPWITDQYDKFTAIAPTVSIKFDDVTPEQFLSIIADAVNSPIAPADAIATFDARVAALNTAIAEKGRQGTVSVVLFYADVLYVYPVDTAFNELPLVGLTSLPAQNEAIGSEWRIEITKEQLPLLDTDYIFLVTYATSAEEETANGEMIARLNEDPIWKTLKAVQNDSVFVVQSQWITGTLLSEHKVLDDLFTYVAQVDPAEVSPNPFLPAES